jgi:rhamnogalacturonyl hydrolase YesR
MTHVETRTELSRRCGITLRVAEDVLRAYQEILMESLLRGDKARIGRVGYFHTKWIAPFRNQHPKYLDRTIMMGGKFQIRFKACAKTRKVLERMAQQRRDAEREAL